MYQIGGKKNENYWENFGHKRDGSPTVFWNARSICL